MSDDYDSEIHDIRVKIAVKRNEWYLLFNKRDKLIKYMVLSLIITWLIMFFGSLFMYSNFFINLLLPNILWIIIFFPYFSYKIYNISIKISIKREEIVLKVYELKTKNIAEIELITGIEKRHIFYYLNKHGYQEIIDQKNKN